MRTKAVEQVVKSSIVYGYAVTQPFLLYNHSAAAPQLDLPQHTASWKESNTITELQHTKPLNRHKHSFSLLKEPPLEGQQSSHEINITEKKAKQTMIKKIKKEKRAAFKEIASDIHLIDYGESSDHVKKVQQTLADYNYYEGEMDGVYGPLTKEALKKAKKDKVLPKKQQTTKEVKQSNEIKTSDAESNHPEEEASETVQLEVKNPTTNIIQEAKAFIGTPYSWGGTSPSGFDCSGFIQYVYKQDNKTIPRTVREIWNYGKETTNPSIGDLVFFETYQAGPSHLGIYLGNGDFIHAGTSSGVTISNYKDNEYWSQRYIGAKNIN